MKKYLLCFVFVSSAFLFSLRAQDIHFSQYSLTPMLVNPAQAGAYKSVEGIVNYKTQWTSISPNAYKTMMFTFDGRIMQKKWRTKWLAAGLNIYNDKAGDGKMGTMQTTASMGYHIMINDKSTLGGCLFGGYAQRKIDYSNLTWDEQYQNGSYNNINPTGEEAFQTNNKFGYPDVGMGVLYQYTKGQMYSTANDMLVIRTGVSLFHLNHPKYSYYSTPGEKLYTKVLGHADVLVGIKNTKIALMPGFIYMQQGPSAEIYPGCFVRYMLREQSRFTGFVKGASITVGTHLRANDAVIPSIQFEVAEYTVGFSYDMNVSGLKSATSGRGGFEISLRYGNPNPFLYKSAASFQ
ncbi:MAG: PorP/SprF family type IX secretion system membrane protein [Bacteroidetes bacterium]|nr:PorP/SprF family type IX secretion system membrane protein [Bacteroidota bacterium]